MTSTMCPAGQTADESRTAFGQCMDAVRTLEDARTLDPTRPDPTRNRPEQGSGLPQLRNRSVVSPDPFPLSREVWHHLTAGLRMLSPNDHGRDWPLPRRDRLAQLLAEFDPDLCVKAAREAREIVVSQDRAPNITALFEKKLRESAEVRSAVRGSLQGTGYSEVEFVDGAGT